MATKPDPQKTQPQKTPRSKKVVRRMGAQTNLARRTGAGVIRPDEVYTLEECAVRLEQGSRTIREAFNRGLGSMFFGKRKYILGSDLIDFLKQFKSNPAPNRSQKKAS